jgi:elongation factor Ts
MSFTALDVKNLREKTGCGMMDCKKALSESDGDMANAVDFLRERGLAAAVKKSGRVASEGLAYAISENDCGAIIEVNSETDFTARSNDFKGFVSFCANIVLKNNPENVEELLEIKTESGETVGDILKGKILTIGENIKIRRFKRFEGLVSSYIHAGGKIAVLVSFGGDKTLLENEDFKILGKDIAMQIAAANPVYIDIASVSAEVLEHERKILHEQLSRSGKQVSVIEKIINGRIGKFYKETCLLEQVFIKDSLMRVKQYIENISKKFGSKVLVLDFVRFERGEGLERIEKNFAEEVAKMQGV